MKQVGGRKTTQNNIKLEPLCVYLSACLSSCLPVCLAVRQSLFVDQYGARSGVLPHTHASHHVSLLVPIMFASFNLLEHSVASCQCLAEQSAWNLCWLFLCFPPCALLHCVRLKAFGAQLPQPYRSSAA